MFAEGSGSCKGKKTEEDKEGDSVCMHSSKSQDVICIEQVL